MLTMYSSYGSLQNRHHFTIQSYVVGIFPVLTHDRRGCLYMGYILESMAVARASHHYVVYSVYKVMPCYDDTITFGVKHDDSNHMPLPKTAMAAVAEDRHTSPRAALRIVSGLGLLMQTADLLGTAVTVSMSSCTLKQRTMR